MAFAAKAAIHKTKAPIKTKVKMGGTKVVSQALVKKGATNVVPSVHVRQGDMVVLVAGARKGRKYSDASLKKSAEERNSYRGTLGKVLSVFPKEGKIIVEGVNMITRATRSRNQAAKGGQIKKEGKIFASKVMLYCTSCKKPTRIQNQVLAGGDKVRVCKKCKETF